MRDTDDLPVPTAHSYLHHGRCDRKDEYEDMKKDASDVQVVTKCLICDGFVPVFNVHDDHVRVCDECKKRLKRIMYPAAEDIQHVGYTPEACGYEK